jgi:hypothetical protein
MPEQNPLHDTLQNLHTELQQAQPADDKSREVINSLTQDVQGAIAHPEQHHTLRGRLEDSIDHLEESHPRLTLAIGAVLDNLAAIGL